MPPDIDRSYFVSSFSGGIYPPFKRRRRFRISFVTGLLLFIAGICALSAIGVGVLYSYAVRQGSSVTEEQDSKNDITPRPTISIEGTYTVIGEPTLNVTFIDNVLTYY